VDGKERPYLVLVVLGEAVVCFYLTTVVWVMTRWPDSEAVAYRMRGWDWWKAGASHFLAGSLVGLVGGGTVFIANRPVMRWLGVEGKRIPLGIAGSFAAAIVLAAFIGALSFAIRKPYF
jgi:hypothetical protein